jgi:Cu(I)/Ag(I) efflux system membrane fusion protein
MPTDPIHPPTQDAEKHDPDPMPEGDEPPPRGVRAMAVVRWAILGIAALAAVGSWLSFALAQSGHAGTAAATPKYQCPMHPQIVSDRPGECPICHMTLEPMAAERVGGAAPSTAPSTSPPPQPEAMPRHGHDADGGMAMPTGPRAASAAPGTTPPETTPIQLALDRVQAIGVRTALVTERAVTASLRVTAVVAAADQGASEVHARASGFVEKILVNQTGVSVAAGQAMVAIYSPEIYQAESELLASRQWALSDAGVATSSSARHKLELLGMSGKDIDAVLEKGEPMRDVHVLAPQGGVVEKKNVVLGSFVTPEVTLYAIQDLSRVYVLADVFQRDMGSVYTGLTGKFVATSHPDKPVEARIDLIYHAVDAQARTTRVRMQVMNPGRALLPGEYGNVELATPPTKALTVPRDAVVDTGKATYVFVVEPGGRFVPKAVVLGQDDGDDLTIAAGVEAGDRVVSGATFLIDSESRLQASIAAAGQQRPVAPGAGRASSENGPSCDGDFDKAKYPDKYVDCEKCARIHHGMGSMEADCKTAIPKPWK